MNNYFDPQGSSSPIKEYPMILHDKIWGGGGWGGSAMGWGHSECHDAHNCVQHMLFWGKNVHCKLNPVHTMLTTSRIMPGFLQITTIQVLCLVGVS